MTRLWAFIGVLLILGGLTLPVRAERAAPVQSRLTIYFVTNRQLAGEDELGPKFGNKQARTLQFGSAAIDVLRHKSSPADIDDYRVREIRTYGSVRDMVQAMRTSGSPGKAPRRALVLVHGYNEGLTASVRRAAAIVSVGRIEAVPVVFSWPSANNWRKYHRDLRLSKFSGPAFGQAMSLLNESGAFNSIHVFAHSMGARVVTAAASSGALNGHRKIDGLVVASSDISLPNFRDVLPDLTRVARRILIESYVRDDVLFVSGVRAADAARLGNATQRQMERAKILPHRRVKAIILDDLGVRSCEGGSHRCSETSPQALQLLREFLAGR